MSQPLTKIAQIDHAIINAVKEMGPAPAAHIERHPAVAMACRVAKVKARARIMLLAQMGKIKSDGSAQMPVYCV